MSLRFRAGLPTLIDNQPVPQAKVRTTAQQKKASGQTTDPPPELTADQATLAAHNLKVLAARKAQAAAAQALIRARAAKAVADANETAAENEVTSASAVAKTEIIPPLHSVPGVPQASPLVQWPPLTLVAARPQPRVVPSQPPRPIPRSNR